MKNIPTIAGALLGLAFITFGLNHFLHFIPMGGGPPEGSPPALFFAAIVPTGFLTFVKICEILGGILVSIPKTRNLGLLVLGPIVVNILAFNILIAGGSAVFQAPVIAVSLLSAYLLWHGREAFGGLVNASSK
ncbi:hypothetical protein HW115_15720 [Verrucomicrobiaceae bacterium N1E253]|uniref:DoxX family protein n=1 Tax=Oceaniferula marina TaxID=2748318 RepID=A0A851GMK9_9BACT|nr:hypothetical protein [Oceaniferula marina]NWK57071.1 hypothetical protein [Oceaniferula marina]